MKVPNALTRDDTEHGVYYYLASEVDAALAERDAEIAALKIAHKANTTNMLELLAKHKQHAFNIATQRKVLEQALEVLERASEAGYSIECEAAITAIEGVLK